MTSSVLMDSSGSLWPVPSALKILFPYSQDVLWGAVAFIVTFLAFKYIALPRLNVLLQSRSDATEGQASGAEDVRREALEVRDARDAIIAEAQLEAHTIRQLAQAEGTKGIELARREASTQAAVILADAKLQIQSERDLAVRDLRTQVSSLALDLASSVAGTRISDSVSAAAVESFLESITRESEIK